MTIILELSPETASGLEADARAQNRPVADVARDAIAERYKDDPFALPDDIYQTHPLPASLTQSLAEDMREGREDIDAGRVIDGDTFLTELRRRIARK